MPSYSANVPHATVPANVSRSCTKPSARIDPKGADRHGAAGDVLMTLRRSGRSVEAYAKELHRLVKLATNFCEENGTWPEWAKEAREGLEKGDDHSPACPASGPVIRI